MPLTACRKQLQRSRLRLGGIVSAGILPSAVDADRTHRCQPTFARAERIELADPQILTGTCRGGIATPRDSNLFLDDSAVFSPAACRIPPARNAVAHQVGNDRAGSSSSLRNRRLVGGDHEGRSVGNAAAHGFCAAPATGMRIQSDAAGQRSQNDGSDFAVVNDTRRSDFPASALLHGQGVAQSSRQLVSDSR